MPSMSPLSIRTFIEDHSLVQSLRQSGKFLEYKGYDDFPQHLREQNLTAGPLTGPEMIPIPPYVFVDRTGGTLIEILYFGRHLSGYPGIVHGGLLATILDEGLGWCCFPSLPSGVGATVTLEVRYLSPLPTDSFAVLKAETKDVIGRKAWVEGHIETLPRNGEPTIVAEARALFVAPRNGKPPGV
ncbi:thioesterase family protein [Penicillium herquei]|nr:thioesterase family protein [Penicillium herquei]